MIIFELQAAQSKFSDRIELRPGTIPALPEMREQPAGALDQPAYSRSGNLRVEYRDELPDEGRFTIFICRFKNGKCRLHLFGKVRGNEFSTEKEIRDTSATTMDGLNERISYVLTSSHTILRTYNLNFSIKSIEDHLMGFLLPF
ncbi:MAG: hypothetical protein ACJ76F_13610 [Bacteroidia bacterium]